MSDDFRQERRRFVGSGSLALLGAGLGMSPLWPTRAHAVDAPTGDILQAIQGATGWVNSPPLTAAGLRGKVVVFDIWTLSCINWLRTLPYVRAWEERYREYGLVMIGVHSPEFAFEREIGNVRRAVSAMRIPYPVAIDNDFAIWRALENHYWPALFVIDDRGRRAYQQFGEGHEERSERAMRDALARAHARDIGPEVGRVTGTGVEAAADWANLHSPESYLGSERAEGFASPPGLTRQGQQTHALPARLLPNQWGISGAWTINPHSIVLNAPDGTLRYSFHARDVHLVMGSALPGTSLRYRVLVDGTAPGAAHGTDIDAEGNGMLSEPRLYQLIRQPSAIRDREITIEFRDAGAEAFVFTFG